MRAIEKEAYQRGVVILSFVRFKSLLQVSIRLVQLDWLIQSVGFVHKLWSTESQMRRYQNSKCIELSTEIEQTCFKMNEYGENFCSSYKERRYPILAGATGEKKFFSFNQFVIVIRFKSLLWMLLRLNKLWQVLSQIQRCHESKFLNTALQGR